MTIQQMRAVLMDYFINKEKVKAMPDNQVFAVYTKLHILGKV